MSFYGNYIKESSIQTLIGLHAHSPNYLIGFKDTKQRFYTVTPSTASFFKIKNIDMVQGLSDYELIGPTGPTISLVPDYILQDTKVLEGYKLTMLDFMPTRDGYKLCITDRLPIINASLEVTGSCFCSKILSGPHALLNILEPFIRKIKKSGVSLILQEDNLIVENQTDNSHKWELEILWLLAQGKSTKIIATYLSRSSRTVEDHIEKIKIKYGCANKSELIQYAIEAGTLNYLPKSLINIKTSQFLSE